MLVVKVEIHSYRTGKINLLGLITIGNIGGSEHRGDYDCKAYRKNAAYPIRTDSTKNIREGSVENHPRLSKPVWNLVFKALKSMGYDK